MLDLYQTIFYKISFLLRGLKMSRVCEISGKNVMSGNNVSHAKIKQKKISTKSSKC